MLEVAATGTPRAQRPVVVSSAILGTLIFVVAEVMFFSGAISAFTISRASAPPGIMPPPGMPDMPSVHESGLAGFEIIGWYGLLGPAGIPAPILNRLHTEIVRILQQQDFRDRVSAEGAEVVTNTPEKFREFLKADVAKWAKLLKESGAKLD